MKRIILYIILFCVIAGSCSNEKNDEQDQFTGPLFTLLNPNDSGLDFKNTLTERIGFNFGKYDYFYNGGGVAIGDLNNDGLADVFFSGNTSPHKLYKNKGDLQFEDVTLNSNIATTGWGTGVVIHDVNNDGLQDIYLCKSGPLDDRKELANQLYINKGNFVFEERSVQFGVADQGKSTMASFFDYDNDGDDDLFVMNHSKHLFTPVSEFIKIMQAMSEDEYQLESNSLYRNDNGKFVNVSKEAGVMRAGFGLGLMTSDFNYDGLIDIYVGNDFFIPDFMYINNGDGTFTDRIRPATNHTSFYSMGADAADFNNDGLIDFAVVDMTPADHIRSKVLMASMNVDYNRYLVEDLKYQPQYMFKLSSAKCWFWIF